MVKITVEIPDELEFMRKIPSIYWTIAVSKVIRAEIERAKYLGKEISKSKLTEKDIEELTDKINDGIYRLHNK